MHCPGLPLKKESYTTDINRSALQGSASKLGRRLSGRLVTNRLTPCVYCSLALLMHLGMLERPGQVVQKPVLSQANNLFQSLNVAYRHEKLMSVRLAKYQTALAVIFCFSFEANVLEANPNALLSSHGKNSSQQLPGAFHRSDAYLNWGPLKSPFAKKLISVSDYTQFGEPKIPRENEWQPGL